MIIAHITVNCSLLTACQGDNVHKMEPKQEPFYYSYSKKQQFETLHEEKIYQCEDDNPPSRWTESVKELCTISYECDMSYKSLEDFIGANGKELKKFSFEVKMIPSGASNEFSVYSQGEKLGSGIARVDFQ